MDCGTRKRSELNRVGGSHFDSRPRTPPYVRIRVRRFLLSSLPVFPTLLSCFLYTDTPPKSEALWGSIRPFMSYGGCSITKTSKVREVLVPKNTLERLREIARLSEQNTPEESVREELRTLWESVFSSPRQHLE